MKKLFLLLSMLSTFAYADQGLRCFADSEWIELSTSDDDSYYLGLYSQGGLGPNNLESSYVYAISKVNILLNGSQLSLAGLGSLGASEVSKISIEVPVGQYSNCELL